MSHTPPSGGAPLWQGGPTLLGPAMPKAGVSHAQALGSPVAAGQGCSSTGMWGAACSGAASWGADPSAKGSRELPPSLLCGCWAQPLGLVKQQDRSRLGERGTGESLNKEFLIWKSLGPAAHYSPPRSCRSARLSTVTAFSAWQPPTCYGFTPCPSGGVAWGAHFWGLGGPLQHLHRPGLVPLPSPLGAPSVPAARWGLQVPHRLPRGKKWGARGE